MSLFLKPAKSSVHIGGIHGVALMQPMFGKGSPLRLWAENGLVCWEDSRDNTYGTMTWKDAAERVLALSQMVINSHESGYYSDETRRLQKFIEEMESVIRKAKENSPEIRHRPIQVRAIKPTKVDFWD